MTDSPSKATLMIVDDSQANLSLLGRLFREQGYAVRPFSRPSLALKAAKNESPDLFLLDINMPEMDGYELCRNLKLEASLVLVPVIFLSTLKEEQDKVKAFGSGGVDYVTKQPFHFDEILARVETHLKIRNLQTILEKQNQELRDSYEQLKRLEEMKDNLTHMIVHDMRSPLTVVHMAVQMLQSEELNIDEETRSGLDLARKATNNLVEMTSLLLDISRLESGKMPLDLQNQSVDFSVIAAVEGLGPLLKGFDVRSEIRATPCQSHYDQSLIFRVLTNLLGNAAKFTPVGGRIVVAVDSHPEGFRISVTDSGPGLPAEEQGLIFEKFGQGKSGKRALGIGLGLTFCKLAVEAHGGHIGVESEPGKGACFWFTLPAINAEVAAV